MQAMLVKLPAVEVLRECLVKNRFDHLVSVTDIVEKLAEKELSSIRIEEIVKESLVTYGQFIKNLGVSTEMNMRKSDLFYCILKAAETK